MTSPAVAGDRRDQRPSTPPNGTRSGRALDLLTARHGKTVLGTGMKFSHGNPEQANGVDGFRAGRCTLSSGVNAIRELGS
jgi:hypothetical protein